MATQWLRLLRPRRRLAVSLFLASALSSALAEPGELEPLAARTLERADAWFRAGRPDSTLALVQPLLESAVSERDSLTELRARLSRASALAVSGRSDEAESESDAALALALDLGRGPEARMAQRWSAFAKLSRGDTEAATEAYTELETASRAAADTLEGSYAQLGLGFLALGSDRWDEARQRYGRAVEGFAARGETAMELESRIGLARAHLRLGHVSEMRAEYDRVLTAARAGGFFRALSIAQNNLGAYEFEAGDPARAVELWHSAVDQSSSPSDPRARLAPLNNLVLARMELGDFDRARDDARALLHLCRGLGDREEEARVLLRLAAIDAATGAWREARDSVDTLLDRADLSADLRAEALLQTAALIESSDGPSSSLEWLRQGQLRFGRAFPANWRGRFSVRESQLLADAGRIEEARTILETLPASGTTLESPAARIGLQLTRAKVFRALDRPDSAAAALDRGLAEWARLRALPRDPQWREQRGRLGQSLHLARALAWLRAPADADSAVERAFLLMASYKARTLNERMRGPGNAVAITPVELDLGALQARLRRDDAVLLDLHLGEDDGLLFVVGASFLEVHSIPSRRALESRARLYRRLMGDPSSDALPSAWMSATERIATILFGSARPRLLRARSIILTPDGITHALPLEEVLAFGLHLEEPVRHRIARAPSVASWMRLVSEREDTSGSGVLAIQGSGDRGLEGLGKELAELGREVGSVGVARFEPGVPLPTQLAAQSAGRAVLHVAAHGEALDRRPWSSRLVLEDSTGTERFLEASEIATLHLDPALTVLSSCESAGGRVLPGEGVLGFGTAFLAAGSRTVVASLWPVDDAVTAGFFAEFYRRLGDGEPAGVALAEAREWVRAHPATRHPVYWAGFVALGDGLAEVHGLRSRDAILGGRRGLALALLVVATGSIGGALLRRRNRPGL